MITTLVERWRTWRTGKTTDERALESWRDAHLNKDAKYLSEYFVNMNHVIQVDPDKFFSRNIMGLPGMDPDVKQYFWPNRSVGNSCLCIHCRVSWDDRARDWLLDGDFGNEEKVIIATQHEKDATMLSLKYA